jgi:hypothetical protein
MGKLSLVYSRMIAVRDDCCFYLLLTKGNSEGTSQPLERRRGALIPPQQPAYSSAFPLSSGIKNRVAMMSNA